MAILVTLQAAETSVQPGATVLVPFRVRNNSAVVDAFTFQVLGAAQGWAILEPSELPLLPGEEKEATIAFSPPRTAAVGAGRYVYGLQVMSRDDSGATTVEEGAIVVAPFSDLVATVTPQTAQAGASANVRVGIENRGNTAAQLTLRALDPDELLAFQIEQASLTVPPGASAEARVGIKHRGRTLRGQADSSSARDTAPQTSAPRTTTMASNPDTLCQEN